jgi:hypothetical protein
MGIGLVVACGSGRGVADADAAARTARFDTICKEYMGYGPSAALKSLLTMLSKLVRRVLSTVSSQSKYKHISLSI